MRFLFILLASCPLLCAAQTVQEYYQKAKDAHLRNDNEVYYSMILAAHKLHPYHLGILYEAGVASALTNRDNEAMSYLTKAININADYNLDNAELNSLKKRNDFMQLQAWQKKLRIAIIHSDTAFVIHNKELHIESITAGGQVGTYYLGSIHKRKIIKCDNAGNFTDFTTTGQDGLCAVFGVKVDVSANTLWACSSPIEEMEHYDSTATSAVYKYDLSTGKLVTKYLPADPSLHSIFGDLTLTAHGDVFISDSKNNIVFKVNEQTKKLDSYFTSFEFWNIQGLAFTPDEKYLFITDYIKGVYRLDTKSKELVKLTQNFDLSTKSIDGLVYYKNSLIGIQNSVNPMRVVRYFLNDNNAAFTRYSIIDLGHPAFGEPTIGFIQQDHMYYVANSAWSGYDDMHNLKPADQLQNVVILKCDLRNIK